MSLGIYALEVGQGDSHIILSEGVAVVIDAGPANASALSFLRRYVEIIDAFILTHNDRDHSGAALKILQEFGSTRRIRSFWSLQDRRCDKRAHQAIAFALELRDKGNLEMFRLERRQGGRPLRITEIADGLVLELLHPSYTDSLEATGIADRSGKGPNRASAVLRLRSESGGIGVWSGDLPASAWLSLAKQEDLGALWFVVPHHGSEVGWTPKAIEAALQTVHPRWSLVSVGTGNSNGHPAPNWIQKSRRCGATVLCTQLTKKCHQAPEDLGQGLLSRGVHYPTNLHGVACAGTVVFRADVPEVLRLDEHQALIDEKLSRPLCRQ